MSDNKKTRILYMDDDTGLARLFQKRLEREGYAVDLAHNGEEGIALHGKALYDVIVVDYNMPVATGLDVIRTLASKGDIPPVIMLTGAGNEKIAAEAMKLGAYDYMVKDVEMGYLELLPVVIEQAMSKRQLIIEKQQMEVELLKARKLESVGILAGGIAHDFNNLLTAIMGNISLAKMHLSPGDRIYDMLDKAEHASMRAGDLTNQLITFSKGGTPFKKTVLIGELIKSVAHFSLSDSDVSSRFDIPADLLPVEIDESQIRQVIHNMIVNAEEAMPNGGTIHISAENIVIAGGEGLPLEEGKHLKISIKDQGIGIHEDNLHRIFDPYFTTKEMGSCKGMGLGLSICYSIVKNHRGHILVESQVGAGTAFHIYLPVSQNMPEAHREAPEKPLVGRGLVLMMDDEQSVRDVAGEMLRRIGYRVEFAKEGKEAIVLYSNALKSGQAFDAVILDLTVHEGMGGKETIINLLEIDPSVRAIVSSGHSSDPVVSEFRQYGFKGVVSKPYKIRDLSDMLSKVMDT